MTNLLPQSEQSLIKKEYKYRRLVVMILLLVGAVVVSSGFLFPSLILSNIKLSTISDAAEKARISNEQQTKDSSSGAVLKTTENKLALLKSKDSETAFTYLVDLITENKSPDIRIKDISYERSDDGNGKIVVSGLSKNRESLTVFSNQMQAISIFKAVDLPVSNFAKDKDISFSMQISGTF